MSGPDPFARKKNPQLKAERGYTDPKSYVRVDGSEVLHGEDWLTRKYQLAMRCGGRCEQEVPKIKETMIDCIWTIPGTTRCTAMAVDPHHIKPRSKGRDDRLSNLQALCRYHHRLLDERKIGGRHAKV